MIRFLRLCTGLKLIACLDTEKGLYYIKLFLRKKVVGLRLHRPSASFRTTRIGWGIVLTDKRRLPTIRFLYINYSSDMVLTVKLTTTTDYYTTTTKNLFFLEATASNKIHWKGRRLNNKKQIFLFDEHYLPYKIYLNGNSIVTGTATQTCISLLYCYTSTRNRIRKFYDWSCFPNKFSPTSPLPIY